MYRIGRPDEFPSNQPQLKQRKILKILLILYHWKVAHNRGLIESFIRVDSWFFAGETPALPGMR
ncbi:MAG: hypothetical protein [Olavius algarvensis Gamma 1 endosymbiont]|nr:MAG: hypothetical protein [Olavius algarvensis Gamma 1 endosymbiont]